jgi:hypothetical protein
MCGHVTLTINVAHHPSPSNINFPFQQYHPTKQNTVWCSDWAYYTGLCLLLRLSSRCLVDFNLFNLLPGACHGLSGMLCF